LKQFAKLGYQSKIVPIMMKADDITSTFRHMVRQFQMSNAGGESEQGTGRTSGLERKETMLEGKEKFADQASDATNLNYMNYDTFKKALVRISIIGCEYLGGQSEEAARKLAEMNDKRNQDA